jgi:hypothetical protein
VSGSISDARPKSTLTPAIKPKEAALKWLGIGMSVPLSSVSITPRGAIEGVPPWELHSELRHPGGRMTGHTADAVV